MVVVVVVVTCGSCSRTLEVDMTHAPRHMGRKKIRMNKSTPTLVTEARARMGSITTKGKGGRGETRGKRGGVKNKGVCVKKRGGWLGGVERG